jgi:GH15 family glucan-1,4-alpha-glucosidase
VAALIEDYALVGDLQSAALISRDGAVDWLGAPRLDSPACLAALLGDERHGQWRISPAAAGGRRRGAARSAAATRTPR